VARSFDAIALLLVAAAAAAELPPEAVALISNVPSPLPPSSGTPSLPVSVVITDRESVLGCHSWSRFLDPRWDTWFAFPAERAEIWRLEQLVLGVDATVSRGAHLLVFADGHSGELLARELVLHELGSRAAQPGGRPVPPLLLGAYCDMQPLPTWHAWHVPFPEMVARMVSAFLADARERAEPSGSSAELRRNKAIHRFNKLFSAQDPGCVELFASERQRKRPLFSLNTIIVEDVLRTDSLAGVHQHGPDSQGWERRGGHTGWRLPTLAPGRPWLSDTSLWMEAHCCLYNVSMLLRLLPQLHAGQETIIGQDRVLASQLCERGWAAITLNDLVLFWDLGDPSRGARRSLPAGAAAGQGLGRDLPLSNLSRFEEAGIDFRGKYTGLNLRQWGGRCSPRACHQEFAKECWACAGASANGAEALMHT
jgi:hypothetical protein